jgi:hypothetical protein
LVHLRVQAVQANLDSTKIAASMLSGAHFLTQLELAGCSEVEPAVLEGKTKLQHLQIRHCRLGAAPDGAGQAPKAAQLLSHLQQLQQVTHLDLTGTLNVKEDTPPATACSVLTASSRLQHLNISMCRLPTAAWHHILPAGRQLPQLRELKLQHLMQPSGYIASAPEGSCLVSCCPKLQSLEMQNMLYSAELPASLQALSGLHTMLLTGCESVGGRFEAVRHLTWLRKLGLGCMLGVKAQQLLQMTQLKQLTTMSFDPLDDEDYYDEEVCLTYKVTKH